MKRLCGKKKETWSFPQFISEFPIDSGFPKSIFIYSLTERRSKIFFIFYLILCVCPRMHIYEMIRPSYSLLTQFFLNLFFFSISVCVIWVR